MSVRSANQFLAIIFIALLCSACVVKSSGRNANGLDAKAFNCNELKQLVVEREQVRLRGLLGSSSFVFASSDACNILTERPVPSTWRTTDKFSCVIGFRCLNIRTLETEF